MVSDVFFNLWKNRALAADIVYPNTYMYKAVRNGCGNLIKSSRYRQTRPLSEISLEVYIDTQTPDNMVQYNELSIALTHAVNALYFRFVSETAGMRIDDIGLTEGEAGEGKLLEFSDYADDGKEPGYVYFEDNFDWVTADFKGSDYIGGFPTATAEMRFDLVTDPALKAIIGSRRFCRRQARLTEPGLPVLRDSGYR